MFSEASVCSQRGYDVTSYLWSYVLSEECLSTRGFCLLWGLHTRGGSAYFGREVCLLWEDSLPLEGISVSWRPPVVTSSGSHSSGRHTLYCNAFSSSYIITYIITHQITVNLNLRNTHIVAVQQDTIAACLPWKRPKEMYNRTGIIESLRYPDTNPQSVQCSWYIYVEDASQVSN